MSFGIRAKITVAASLVVIALTALHIVTGIQTLETNLHGRLREQAVSAVRVIGRVATNPFYVEDLRELRIVANELLSIEDVTSVDVVAPDGRVFAAAGQHSEAFNISEDPILHDDVSINETEDELRVVSAVALGEYPVGSIHMTVSKARVKSDVAAAMWRPLTLGLLVAFIAIVLIVTLAHGITEPLQTLIAGARAVSRGDFSRHVSVATRDELRELAEAFNVMTYSLESSMVSKAYVEGIVEHMKDMLLVLSPAGEIRMANAAACGLLGVRRDKLEGAVVDDYVELESGKALVALFDDVMNAREPCDVEAWFCSAAGARVPVALSLSPMTTETSQRVICVGQDISARREVERSQREARVAAEQANAAKSEFLANMSHEIRTPMTAILGYADLLLEQSDADERQNSVETIRRNGRHLLTIINDILDLSKIEAGKMTLETVAFSPSNLVKEVGELLLPRAQARGIALEVVEETELPAEVASDPTRIRQVLTNLMGNAIKFTSEGSVTLRTSHEDLGDGTACVAFAIEDTGIGLTKEQADNLFSAFVQADSSTTRKFGGTGLGLVISRHMATMLGGTIEVASEHGKGSTFTATMIVKLDTEGIAGERSRATPTSQGDRPLDARILLAEDGRDNQHLISFVLKKVGATVAIANNGREAVDLALEAQAADEPFDVILMDMQMPVLDGYDATAELRAERYVGPIIALTANAMEGDRDRCLHAGCDDYTTKPIKRAELVHLVRTYATTTLDVSAKFGDVQSESR